MAGGRRPDFKEEEIKTPQIVAGSEFKNPYLDNLLKWDDRLQKQLSEYFDDKFILRYREKLELDLKKITKILPEKAAEQQFINHYNYLNSRGLDVIIVAALMALDMEDEDRLIEIINQIIKSNIDLLSTPIDSMANTLFHRLIDKFNKKSIQLCLQHNVPRSFNKLNQTPLIYLINKIIKLNLDLKKYPVVNSLVNLLIDNITITDVMCIAELLLNSKNLNNKHTENNKEIIDFLYSAICVQYEKALKDNVNEDVIVEFKSINNELVGMQQEYFTLRDLFFSLLKKSPQEITEVDINEYIVALQDLNRDLLSLKDLNKENLKAVHVLSNMINHFIELCEYQIYKFYQAIKNDKKATSVIMNIIETEAHEVEKRVLNYQDEEKQGKQSRIALLHHVLLFEKMHRTNPKDKQKYDKKISLIELLKQLLISKDESVDKNEESKAIMETCPVGRAAIHYARSFIKVGATQMAMNSKFYTPIVKAITLNLKDVRIDAKEIYFSSPMKAIVNIERSSSIATAQHLLATIKKYSLGNCGEYADLALDYVVIHNSSVSSYQQVTAEIFSMVNGDHEFLVIGRKAGSNEFNPEEWGEDAYICDPWANKLFKAVDYLDHLKVYLSKDDEHYVSDVIPFYHTLYAIGHGSNTEELGKRNSKEYLNSMYGVYKTKLNLLRSQLKPFINILRKIRDEIIHIFGKKHEISVSFSKKIASLKEVYYLMEEADKVSLNVLITKTPYAQLKDPYYYVKETLEGNLQKIILKMSQTPPLTEKEQNTLKGQASMLEKVKLFSLYEKFQDCLYNLNYSLKILPNVYDEDSSALVDFKKTFVKGGKDKSEIESKEDTEESHADNIQTTIPRSSSKS